MYPPFYTFERISFISIEILQSLFPGTDLKAEVTILVKAMHLAFIARKQPVIFDPWQFRQFC